MPESGSGAPTCPPLTRAAGAILLATALTVPLCTRPGTADASTAAPPSADGSAPPPATHDAMAHAGERLTERVVIPTRTRLVDASGQLVEAAAAFERAPSQDTLRALRRAWLRTAAAVAAGRAFAFGPMHSLGHDTAFRFPTDEAGVARTIEGLGDASVADIERMRLTPSLTGLDTLAHLLGVNAAEAVPEPTRRYAHALARRIDGAARESLAVWRDGHDGRPPFADVLATAGAPDNRAYPSAASAAEEIVRGVLDTLDLLAGEELPERLERVGAPAADDEAAALSVLRAAVDGAGSAYDGAGIAGWVDADGATVDAEVRAAFELASEALTVAIAATGDVATSRSALERAIASLERAHALIDAHALPRPSTADDTPPGASAGAATVDNRTSSAYEAAPPNLTPKGVADHDLGDEAFEESFVLTEDHANAGLGPTFNNTSCVGCHIRNGRGMPVPGQLLLRVSDALPGGERAVEEESDTLEVGGNTPPVAGLGNQIQDFAVAGGSPEAHVDIDWVETSGEYPDGTPYTLRAPRFEIVLASTGEPLPEMVRVSPRVPPHVYGLGLLEAVPEETLLALADPDDRDGDGISGRPNRVWDEQRQGYSLGRFGWKANSPNLLQQTADAYLNDMGIHSPMFPAEDGSSEIDEATLVAATAYSQTLAAPARAAVDDPTVRRGEALFADVGCVGCHVPTLETGTHKYPALEGQVIHPYTDLLLHDMGEGLADGRPDFAASGREWRTPSLWGIGLAQTVLPYSGFLHDGRARTFEEAILWHGGEAEHARNAFTKLDADERRAMVRFLGSL